jgi:hypothetical protein
LKEEEVWTGAWKKPEHRSLVGSRSTIMTGLTVESKIAARGFLAFAGVLKNEALTV